MELWASCEAFGEATRRLRQSLLDSLLAKQAKHNVVDLTMFSDQQTLCDYLHDNVALHPFRMPSETELETTPASALDFVTNAPATAGGPMTAAGAGVQGSQVPFRLLQSEA